MYVQINKELRDRIKPMVVANAYMGSHAYGLDGKRSDLDVVFLYYDNNFDETFCWERNGWQYKTDGVDENYQEIRHFVQNLIVGESPADYEALRCGFTHIRSVELVELLKYLTQHCATYTLIKSYLGYIKKDYVRFTSIPTVYTESPDMRKAVSHLVRGESIVRHLRGDGHYQFTRDASDHGAAWETCNRLLHGISHAVELGAVQMDDNPDDWTFLTTSTDMQAYSYSDMERLAKKAYQYAESTRSALTDELNAGRMLRRMSIETMKEIDCLLRNVIYDLRDLNIGYRIDYGDIRYRIIEKGVTHQYVK